MFFFFQKLTLALVSICAAVSAQRPSYAGFNPIGVPQLASRFKDNSTSTSTTTTESNLANRIGADETTTVKLPVDARGDADLVNRISQWPRENQPFWLINAEHIEKHRNPQGQGKSRGKKVSLIRFFI